MLWSLNRKGASNEYPQHNVLMENWIKLSQNYREIVLWLVLLNCMEGIREWKAKQEKAFSFNNSTLEYNQN